MGVSVELIPISNRVCDLCCETVTAEDQSVTNSFVLTDWGVVCIECWDNKVERFEEFKVVQIYLKATRVEDEWVRKPLLFSSASPDRDLVGT